MNADEQQVLHVTNGYPIDFDQLARILHLASSAQSKTSVRLDDIAETLGMTDKKAKYVAAIAVALDVIRPKTFGVTPSGLIISRHDPFFDDIGTLWWLHYCISSNPRNIVWGRLTNELLPTYKGFSPSEITTLFQDLAGKYAATSLGSHLDKEVNAFVRAYTESNLCRLSYLVLAGHQYRLGYREPVPPLVIAACIVHFRDQHRPGDTALSVTDLLNARNSPGVVCQIPEDRLRAALEALKTQPGLSLESRADLDQVRLTDATPDYQWMERYYNGRG
jgi:hypothetical protein